MLDDGLTKVCYKAVACCKDVFLKRGKKASWNYHLLLSKRQLIKEEYSANYVASDTIDVLHMFGRKCSWTLEFLRAAGALE